MKPTTENRRHGLIATLPLALLVAACGTAASTTKPATFPTTPTATATPTPSPAPTPSAVPTPAPEPPLAFFVNYGAALGAQQWKVVNAQGVEQWGLTPFQEGKLFGLTAQQVSNANLTPQAGATNLFLIYQASATSSYQIAVFSRTGKLLGIGTAPGVGPTPNSSESGNPFEVSPSAPEWAWTVDQTPNATGNHHGVVEVGGLGKTNQIVYRWAAPVGFTEQLDSWTDTGIIMQRIPEGSPFICGDFNDPASAWFAINPSAGTLHALVAGNEQFMDASSGVTAAGLINDSHTVLVNGVKYSESKSFAGGAIISPDGTEVAVFRESFDPCGGGNIPTTSIEIVTLANQSHVDLPGLGLVSWWDSHQILANPTAGSLWIYTLQGKPVSELSPPGTPWNFIGVLS
jgi:hypothetical protein